MESLDDVDGKWCNLNILKINIRDFEFIVLYDLYSIEVILGYREVKLCKDCVLIILDMILFNGFYFL